MADEHYDAIVIGTSQGGRFLPVELAKAGQKVALIERDQLGGVCVNRGCTPTKTMVASARLAYQARRGAEYGVRTGPVSVDLAAVRERKRAMVAGARQDYASRLAQDGLDLIQGEAHFTGPKTVEIALTDGGTRRISAPVVVIDAGTRPKPLAITGAGDVPGARFNVDHGVGRAPGAPGSSSAAATSGWSSGRCSAGSAARSPSSKAQRA